MKLLWRGLARTPAVTAVMILALSLGIGTWYAQHQVFAYLATKEPTAARGVYHVARAGNNVEGRPQLVIPILGSLLLAPGDAARVLAAAPARKTATFGAPGLLGDTVVRVRYATPDLFAMFEIPLVAGAPFASGHEAVVDEALGIAVGETIRVDGIAVRVAGVVARHYRDRYHLYERFVPTLDAVYLPLAMAVETHAQPDFEHRVAGRESGYLSTWVEGRTTPPGFFLRDADEMRAMFAPGGTINLWPLLAAMCLVTCVVNLVRMLMVKFGGRSHDLGLQRAFGAKRRRVMGQLLAEATAIGVIAGMCGVLVGAALMPLASATLEATAADATTGSPTVLDLTSALFTITASTAAALLAALYPAWTLSRGTPAAQLGRT